MDVRIVGGGRCSEPVELIGAVSRSSGNGEEAMRHLGGRLDWTGMGDGRRRRWRRNLRRVEGLGKVWEGPGSAYS